MSNGIKVGEHTEAHIELYTVDGKGTPKKMFIPVLLDEIKWSSTYEVNPSKMTYTVLKDGVINFGLGTKTVLKINNKVVWSGYTMYKHRTSDVKIECIAYDQIRYLKNKVSIATKKNENVMDFLKRLIDGMGLSVGTFDAFDGYQFSELSATVNGVYEDKEVLEIIDSFIQSYDLVFYDDAGKVCCRTLENMRVTNQFFTAEEMEDWDYTSSIENSYNQICVASLEADAETLNKTIIAEDKENINRWGLLRYSDESTENESQIKTKADMLLKLLNRETRTLNLKKVLGNTEVHGGSLIAVKLNLGDMLLYSWMVVKEVTHTLSQDGYWMDIVAENQNIGFADPVNPEGTFVAEKVEADENATAGAVSGGATNDAKIYNSLRANGCTAEAACGILGILWGENSKFDPKLWQQGGGPGYGICQWEKGGRRDTLVSWCASNGKLYDSIEGQIAYMLYELNGGDATWVAYLKNGCKGSQCGGARSPIGSVAKFKALKSIEQAAHAFLWYFERAGIPRWEDRLAEAKKYYNKWGKYTTVPEPKPNTGAGSGGSNVVGAVGSWSGIPANSKRRKLKAAAEAMYGWAYSQGLRMSWGYCDCSSFVHRALADAGLAAPIYGNAWTTKTMPDYTSVVYQIPWSDLRPGDIVLGNSAGGHVAFYWGNDAYGNKKTLESCGKYGVCYGYINANGWYYNYETAWRVVGIDG